MSCIKKISVEIFKSDRVLASERMFQSLITAAEVFPPEHLEQIVKAVTGWTFDDDDHSLANNLHTHGCCQFRFGPDWEWFVQAEVTYNE